MPTGWDPAVWSGKKDIVDSRLGARTIGTRAMVDVGWQVWTYLEQQTDADGQPVGGVVLEVVDITEDFDEDTGEVQRERGFMTLDPYTLKRRRLAESWINPDSLEFPDRYLCHRLMNRLARDLIKIKHNLGNEQKRLDIARDIFRLAAASRIGGRT